MKTLIFAPDNLAPNTSDAWFSSSLTIRSPLPTRVGMLVELVAKPIPNVIAAGLPINRATRCSNSSCRFSRVPAGERNSHTIIWSVTSTLKASWKTLHEQTASKQCTKLDCFESLPKSIKWSPDIKYWSPLKKSQISFYTKGYTADQIHYQYFISHVFCMKLFKVHWSSGKLLKYISEQFPSVELIHIFAKFQWLFCSKWISSSKKSIQISQNVIYLAHHCKLHWMMK